MAAVEQAGNSCCFRFFFFHVENVNFSSISFSCLYFFNQLEVFIHKIKKSLQFTVELFQASFVVMFSL